jgi:hypothetical protein
MDADQPETKTHSFVIRVWLEEVATNPRRLLWRGHITHIPDGQRRYVQTLEEVTSFVRPYLAQMGVPLSVGARIRAWLARRTA